MQNKVSVQVSYNVFAHELAPVTTSKSLRGLEKLESGKTTSLKKEVVILIPGKTGEELRTFSANPELSLIGMMQYK